jgi:hypothetical protein
MMRRFKFEDEIHQSLSCVPMAVRRKLDQIGLKISLEQWQTLGRGERLAICHMPIESAEERDAVALFIDETVRHRCGSAARPLREEIRHAADPPASPPAALVANAKSHGFEVGQPAWEGLDQDERYALMKLGGGTESSHNFRAALREFLPK